MKATTKMIVGILAAPLVLGSAFAASVPQQDAQWLQGIHPGSQFVIQASKYEVSHGSAKVAMKAAQKLIEQDEYVDGQARKLAKAQHVSLPNELTQKQQQELSEIKATSGAHLDKLYSSTLLAFEIGAGNKTLKEITHGQSQEIKSFATFLLPAINLEANMYQHAVSNLKSPP